MSDNLPLWGALAAAQAEFPAIGKNKEVTVTPRDGGRAYKFKYATLETIFSAVRPALAKHGLSVFHRIEYQEGNPLIVAVLAHKDGGKIECPFSLPLAGKMQEQGSALTYGRRYTLQCVLGIAADDDDDANGADGNQITEQTERKPSAKVTNLPPTPSEKKAQEIESGFRAAKTKAAMDQIVADNKAHIDAMSDELRARVRSMYGNCLELLNKAA